MSSSRRLLPFVLAGFAVALPASALARDPVAGKAKFDAACADCHEPADFADRSAAELETQLQGISAGTIKHKGKVKLGAVEIGDLAAYLVPTKGASGATPPAGKPATASAAAAKSGTPSATGAAKTVAPTAASAGASPTKAADAKVGAAATSGAVAAGRAVFAKQCAECHEADEFAGESVADLAKTIDGIGKGTVKHKKRVALSAADAQSVAAYLATAK